MDVKQTLQDLEELLLVNTVRKNVQKVSSLLAPEFREYGSSGRSYSRAEIIDQLQSEPSTDLSLRDFEIQHLCGHAILATYRAVNQTPGSLPVESLRSSIWVYRDERWQMLFHQGTKAPQVNS
jgi:hypothetical protein